MPYVDVKARVAEFEKENGYDSVVMNGFLLFSTGAMRDMNPLGILMPPPPDAYQRAKLIVKYHQRKLDLAVEEFDTVKNNLLAMTKANLKRKSCPPPPSLVEDATQQLKELKAKVRVCQKNINKAQADFEDSKPSHLKTNEDMDTISRNDNETLLKALLEIEI